MNAKRMLAFAVRTAKEILRDPLTLIFGIGFPVVLLLLFTAIQANVPVELFEIEKVAPGMCIFGLAFMTLFSAQLLAKDRETAFFQRLYTSPLTSWDFILGYALPLIPIAVAQSIICYAVAIVLGLTPSVNILLALVFIIPSSLIFISCGLICGTLLNTKQVGGLCGALFTNLTAVMSGVWFDISLVGDGFNAVANILPFVHAVEVQRAVIVGDFAVLQGHIAWVAGYAVVLNVAAVAVMRKH